MRQGLLEAGATLLEEAAAASGPALRLGVVKHLVQHNDQLLIAAQELRQLVDVLGSDSSACNAIDHSHSQGEMMVCRSDVDVTWNERDELLPLLIALLRFCTDRRVSAVDL